MAKYTVTMDGRGRIQLPEELRQSVGWLDQQWYVMERSDDGVVIKLAEGPEAPETIRRVLSSRLQPLGEGRGQGHNQYVSRWRHRSGTVVVSENGQPNIWISKTVADQFEPDSLPAVAQVFLPGDVSPGFHSNVAATFGLKGQVVVKLRADRNVDARKLAEAIVDQLEKAK